MKMTKKIMLGVVAAAAIVLTGCANLGDGDLGGTKYKKTLTLDATEITEKYSRAFAQLSTSKKVKAIETEISVKAADCTSLTKSVVGLAFDVHLTKDSEGKEFYDFVLVGLKPADGFYYVERYKNVSKDALKEDMKTNEGTIGGTYTAICPEVSGWSGTALNVKDGDDYKWTVKVTQDAGVYTINVNDKSYTYTGETKDDDGDAIGMVFLYGNAPKGEKFKAAYNTNKDKKATIGLFADDEE